MFGQIARVDRWLADHRPEYYAHLQPGVSEAALDAFESRFSLQLPAAFRDLYRWRNGQRPECNQSLQHNWMFSPLEEIAELRKRSTA